MNSKEDRLSNNVHLPGETAKIMIRIVFLLKFMIMRFHMLFYPQILSNLHKNVLFTLSSKDYSDY